MGQDNRRPYSSIINWQWNCRSYRKKRDVLQQHLTAVGNDAVPDVIALQETYGISKLAGYRAFSPLDTVPASRPHHLVTTLVRRNIPVIQHAIGVEGADHVLVELVFTTGQRKSSVFILNTYSSPQQAHRFSKLFRRAADLAGHHSPLLFLGDFNAPHTAWGYGRNTAKGTRLWLDAQQERLTLLIDPMQPTRRGTSTTQDTTPDLTFIRNHHRSVTWTNTRVDLGSDHYILSIHLETPLCRPRAGVTQQLVDWPEFRKARLQGTELAQPIENISEWVVQLRQDVQHHTRPIPQEAQIQQADSRLLRLWEAKSSSSDGTVPDRVAGRSAVELYNFNAR
ncbi:hypothetical protein HPB48_026736 [Haemaphysalis longicornis]|uniref:Endonuclease/exonuclease/phosphatase domain-containing protein n=1 Tax=Haemaphysalis longicornis TaxID=44386 RepID=A0A9J6HD29_HAELO|nr:hypothetical protein HPB48_026736 [Haemaphysalis longicornis]